MRTIAEKVYKDLKHRQYLSHHLILREQHMCKLIRELLVKKFNFKVAERKAGRFGSRKRTSQGYDGGNVE